mmetsp:Transcript_15247/g.17528  ORF Transcript_15247/g.17528 Transcript_15247/m.17528 type:complete len:279 (+) Transcript_15247:144-980(+)|eukprot:CAMPEP_0194353506 /NCGR_PEP_ID=MMETSP0174-20130528/1824_1 /TAXON_ID=216777 /ORGANISM="Proboscia alata, Strain PI-D3" /LENGTH=278 /DNA_ID=CAMNT_0039122087 /DNA_START=60 /DNA_END=896 /DNA_ORIENTATION=+
MSKTPAEKNSSSIPHIHNKIGSHESEIEIISTRHGEQSWQAKYLNFVYSPKIQHTLMALLLIDVLILFIEMFLDVEYPHCRFVIRDATSCGKDVDLHEGGVAGERYSMERFLSEDEHGDGGGGHHVCESPLVETGVEPGCDEHQHPGLHTTHAILFCITIVILVTFFIEVMTMLLALGSKLFFSHPLYVLDLVVITLALVLELTFHNLDQDDLGQLLGLLIIGRLWRLVRIGHGLVSTTYEVGHEVAEELEEKILMLEEELEKNGLPLPDGYKKNSHV